MALCQRQQELFKLLQLAGRLDQRPAEEFIVDFLAVEQLVDALLFGKARLKDRSPRYSRSNWFSARRAISSSTRMSPGEEDVISRAARLTPRP